jgi:hypothetical protein
MFKLSSAISLIAVLVTAPSALALEVHGNASNSYITVDNFGIRNVSGIDSSTYTDQHQSRNNNPLCASRNQIQRNIANTGISTRNTGFRNNSGVSNKTVTRQNQNANCSIPSFR